MNDLTCASFTQYIENLSDPTLKQQTNVMLIAMIDKGFRADKLNSFEIVEKGHGRIETRRCWNTEDIF